MRHLTLFMLCVATAVLMTCSKSTQQRSAYLDCDPWKDQALTDILSFWTTNAIDSANGTFYCQLDGDWNPEGTTVFPSMIARHLFSYSAAYLMSGSTEYIIIADNIKDYLLTHAWDKQHGGWYDALTVAGDPQELTKSTFVQVYVITGLALYYMVTHDAEVLDYIERSNQLLEENAWDKDSGGYFDASQQDWTLRSKTKSVSSQLAPISGYLLYMYNATRDERYLRQAERISDNILMHMTDSTTGWVLETFDQNWEYHPGATGRDEINVGHNIELAWSLLRMYLLNKREDYLQVAMSLSDSLREFGFDEKNGVWFATIGNRDPTLHSNFTYWWIQAYGNMFDLCLQYVKSDNRYLDDFRKGAAFWNKYFIDKKKGDTHLSVLLDGTPSDVRKANQYKASYHSVEHCLLNYLYLTNWSNPKPFTLYFRLSATEGERLYPLPIEQSKSRVSRVVINGTEYHEVAIDSGFVRLSSLREAVVEVSIQ